MDRRVQPHPTPHHRPIDLAPIKMFLVNVSLVYLWVLTTLSAPCAARTCDFRLINKQNGSFAAPLIIPCNDLTLYIMQRLRQSR
jgi:hypothetical protein